MVKFVTRQQMQESLKFWFQIRFGTLIENMRSAMPIMLLFTKIEGNDDYRDISDQDLEMETIKEVISNVFSEKKAMCMILKNDNSKRVAIIFDELPEPSENFEENFTEALKKSKINFKSGWMEDFQDLVYIIQF